MKYDDWGSIKPVLKLLFFAKILIFLYKFSTKVNMFYIFAMEVRI